MGRRGGEGRVYCWSGQVRVCRWLREGREILGITVSATDWKMRKWGEEGGKGSLLLVRRRSLFCSLCADDSS